jgi:membrane protease YdiL (CAAX protease family)
MVLITVGSLTKSFNNLQLFLLPIGIVAVVFQKFIHKEKIRELGFQKCKLKHVGKALVFPLLIIFFIFLLDIISGFVKFGPGEDIYNPFSQQKEGVGFLTLILIIMFSALMTFVAAFITEELGFRGYLITRFRKYGSLKALLFSSILFGLFHLPPSLLLWQAGMGRSVVYVINITLLGLLFGYVFIESKSLVPPSLFHGVWNALEYTLFGYGSTQGVLVGEARFLFDPEEGLAGTVVLLIASFYVLWKIKERQKTP